MSEGTLIKPDWIPQEAWDQGGPAARDCFRMLVKRLREFERRPGMNSGNSSLPPYSDWRGQPPGSSVRPKSARKRGGQSGHMKRTRPLIPTEASDRAVHHRPAACTDCGSRLSGDDPIPNAISSRIPRSLSRLSQNIRFTCCGVRNADNAVGGGRCLSEGAAVAAPAALSARAG